MNWFVSLILVCSFIWLIFLTKNQLKIKKEADLYKGKFYDYEDDYEQYKQIVTSVCDSGIDVPIKAGTLFSENIFGATLRVPTEPITLNIPMPPEICTNPIFSS